MTLNWNILKLKYETRFRKEKKAIISMGSHAVPEIVTANTTINTDQSMNV